MWTIDKINEDTFHTVQLVVMNQTQGIPEGDFGLSDIQLALTARKALISAGFKFNEVLDRIATRNGR